MGLASEERDLSEQDQVEELTEILRVAKPAVVVRALRRAYPTVNWPGPSEWRRVDFDLEVLEKLAALGLTVQEAASFLGVSRSTMNRRLREPAYRRAWDRGQVGVKIALRRAQLKRALEGNTPMLIWMGKQLLGQKNNPDPPEPLLEPSRAYIDADELERRLDEIAAEVLEGQYVLEREGDGEEDRGAPAGGSETAAPALARAPFDAG